MKTKRAFLVEPKRFEIKEVDIQLQPDQVLVKVSVCGLCNWELNHWKGILGPYPQTIGHEWGGIVVETGKDVKEFKCGDLVTTLSTDQIGFSEYSTVGKDRCFKVNSSVDPVHAIGEPLKSVITVIKGTLPEVGDIGVILGCGPMGLWCIQALAGNFLSKIIALDVDDGKLKLAKLYGATNVINPKNENAVEVIKALTSGAMADFVIEGTGNTGILNNAVSYIKDSGRGKLILMSSHEAPTTSFDFREAISKSIDIRFPHPRHSLNWADDMKRAVLFLDNGTFDMEKILTHRFALDNIQEAFQALEHKPEGFIKGVVVP